MFWQLAGSIVGVFAIAALVWYLGMGRVKLADEAQAQRLAEDMVSGFHATEVILSDNRDAALLIGEDKSFVTLKTHGSKFAARHLQSRLNFLQVGENIEIDSGERAYGKVLLTLTAEKSESLADRLLTGM